jgi:hypothetical protein
MRSIGRTVHERVAVAVFQGERFVLRRRMDFLAEENDEVRTGHEKELECEQQTNKQERKENQ